MVIDSLSVRDDWGRFKSAIWGGSMGCMQFLAMNYLGAIDPPPDLIVVSFPGWIGVVSSGTTPVRAIAVTYGSERYRIVIERLFVRIGWGMSTQPVVA